MLRFVKQLLMDHTTLFINSASQRCKWSGEGLTQIPPPLPPTAVCQIVPGVNTLSSLSESSIKPKTSPLPALWPDKPPVRGKIYLGLACGYHI